jgi:hypothetical protein
MFRVRTVAAFRLFQVRFLFIRLQRRAPKAPMAEASVGVQIPL